MTSWKYIVRIDILLKNINKCLLRHTRALASKIWTLSQISVDLIWLKSISHYCAVLSFARCPTFWWKLLLQVTSNLQDCIKWHLWKWLQVPIAIFKVVLTALFGCYVADAMWNCCCLGTCSVYTIYNHAVVKKYVQHTSSSWSHGAAVHH